MMKRSILSTRAGRFVAAAAWCCVSCLPAGAQPASPAPNQQPAAVTAPIAQPETVDKNAGHFDPALLARPARIETPQERSERLRASAAAYFATAAQKRAELHRRAQALGIPLEISRANGEPSRLFDITPEGEALYVSPNNIAAADTIKGDNLWPAGSVTAIPNWITGETGDNLSGNGQTIGLWDPSGSVLTTHEQFQGGRVTQLDGNPSPVGFHATWVAGTLTSAGIDDFVDIGGGNILNVGNHSRGIAYAANVSAYDLADISGERDLEASQGMKLACHPYALNAGWSFDGTAWLWWGTGASQEDWKFGAYLGVNSGIAPRELDSASYSEPNLLEVYSAGDDRNDGPGGPTTYFLSTDPNHTNPQTATRDWNDGDAGGYDSLNPVACAKDILTVGGTYDIAGGYSGPSSVVTSPFSSMGPTDDGRIKPDVVAAALRTGTGAKNPNGFVGFLTTDAAGDLTYRSSLNTIGNSFAAPTVCGGLALALQRRDQQRPEWINNGYPIRSSTLRGLAIHTADEAGPAAGPDYQFGYGLFDATAAVTLMDQDITSGANPAFNGPKPFIKEVLLQPTKIVQFNLHATSTSIPLKATICWTDPAGPAQTSGSVDQTTKRLVNDVDLRIYPPGTTVFNPSASSTFKPWILNPDLVGKSATVRAQPASTGDDSVNNVEQVVVNNPSTSGDYIVQVTFKGSLSGGEQWVSVLLSGNTVPAVDFRITNIANQGNGNFVITWNSVVGAIYRIQGSANVIGPYTDMTPDIPANLESMSYLVTAPNGSSQFFWRIARYY